MQQVPWEEVYGTSSFLSASYKLNGHVFTSGCIGTDPTTGELPESVEAQTINVVKNVEAVLKASGSNLNRVLKVLLFVSSDADTSIVNKIYTENFVNKPARSCVIVSFPNPKIKVELECVAEYEDLNRPKV